MRKKLTLLFLTVAVVCAMGISSMPVFAGTLGTAINSAADFAKIDENSSGNYYLNTNITLSKGVCQSSKKPFTGTFDGNGYTISGYTQKNDAETTGLFGYASKATIKNVKLSNVDINCTALNYRGEDWHYRETISYCGALLGYGDGCNISKITVSGTAKLVADKVENPTAYIGGIVGYMSDGTITTSTNQMSIDVSSDNSGFIGYIGGIAGKTDYTQYSSDVNSGQINFSGKAATISEGGISGFCNSTTEKLTVISKCKNTKAVSASVTGDEDKYNAHYVGGITGTAMLGTINKSSNSGAITFVGKSMPSQAFANVGGLSAMQNMGKITESYNKGKITVSGAYSTTGGISGICPSIQNCYNVGDIKVTKTGRTGGITGYASDSQGYYIRYNYSKGTISALGIKGTIIGQYDSDYSTKTSRCYSNYYKLGNFYGKESMAKANKNYKISTFSKGKMSKLNFTKTWVYSVAKERPILRNCKEA